MQGETKTIAVLQMYSPLLEEWFDRENQNGIAELTDEQLREKVRQLNSPNPSRMYRGVRRTLIDAIVAPWEYCKE